MIFDVCEEVEKFCFDKCLLYCESNWTAIGYLLFMVIYTYSSCDFWKCLGYFLSSTYFKLAFYTRYGKVYSTIIKLEDHYKDASCTPEVCCLDEVKDCFDIAGNTCKDFTLCSGSFQAGDASCR